MRTRWLSALVLLLVLCSTLAAQWQLAPKPQSWFDVKAIAVESGKIMAGVADYESMSRGGVWATTDNGTTWTMLLTGISVECVLQSGSHMFAGQTFGGLQMSTNAGATWSIANTDGGGMTFTGLAIKDGVLFASSFGGGPGVSGILRSTNLGSTWTPAVNGMSDERIVALSSSPNVLLAGAYANEDVAGSGGVYRSADLGLTWTHSSFAGVTVWSFTSVGTMLFAGATNGIHRSTDDGATWQPIFSGIPLVTSLASSGSTIIAGTSGGGMYVSTDEGNSWTSFNDGLTDPNVRALGANGQTLLAGTGLGMFTFTPTVVQPIPAPLNLTATSRLHSVKLVWDRIMDPRPLQYVVYAGTAPEPVTAIDTVDAGTDSSVNATVSPLTAGVEMHFRVKAIDGAGNEGPFSSEVTATPLGYGTIAGTVMRSGVAADSIVVRLQDTTMTTIAQTMTMSGGYAFGDLADGEYYVDLVEPSGFTAANNPRRVSVTLSETTTVNFALVAVTSDTCRHWRGYWRHQIIAWLKGLQAQESFWDMLRYILEIARNYCDRFPMFKGLGGLAQWDHVFNPEHCTTIKEHAISHLGAMLMNFASHRCEKHTIATKDGRTYWDVAVHASNLLNDADASNDAVALEIASAANEGREIGDGIVPSVDGLTGVEEEEIARVPGSFALLGNYPNPFNPSTTLSYELSVMSVVDLRVFDLLGHEVAVLVDREQEAGHYAVTFDAAGLPSGTYICRIVAGQFTATTKMILAR